MANMPPKAAAAKPTVATTIAKMTISISSPLCLIFALPTSGQDREGEHFLQVHQSTSARGSASMSLDFMLVGSHGDGGEDQCQTCEDQRLDEAYQ